MKLFRLLTIGSSAMVRSAINAFLTTAALVLRRLYLATTTTCHRCRFPRYTNGNSATSTPTTVKHLHRDDCESATHGKLHEASGSSSSMLASTFQLVNNVAGAGLLALSASQAAGTGYIPAIAIAVGLGALSARTFILLGYACDLTGERDFKVRTVGIFKTSRPYPCAASRSFYTYK